MVGDLPLVENDGHCPIQYQIPLEAGIWKKGSGTPRRAAAIPPPPPHPTSKKLERHTILKAFTDLRLFFFQEVQILGA